MHRMICRHRFIFMVAMGLGMIVTATRGGNLNPTAGPESAASAMWTLNDIYNVMDTRTTNVTKRAGAAAFAEPGGLPTNGTMHTLNEIMILATNRTPVQKTGQTAIYAVGDDGTYRIGVAWPNPRFSPVAASGAETNQIWDNLTGLIWARNANFAGGTLTWQAALDYIAATNASSTGYGGTNDWRLPNVREMLSLIAWPYASPAVCNTAGTAKWTEGNPFTGLTTGNRVCWSSTSLASPTYAWHVDIGYGLVNYTDKAGVRFVWPVRGGR